MHRPLPQSHKRRNTSNSEPRRIVMWAWPSRFQNMQVSVVAPREAQYRHQLMVSKVDIPNQSWPAQ